MRSLAASRRSGRGDGRKRQWGQTVTVTYSSTLLTAERRFRYLHAECHINVKSTHLLQGSVLTREINLNVVYDQPCTFRHDPLRPQVSLWALTRWTRRCCGTQPTGPLNCACSKPIVAATLAHRTAPTTSGKVSEAVKYIKNERGSTR